MVCMASISLLDPMSWSKYNTLSQHCHTLLANEKTAAVAAELLNLVRLYSRSTFDTCDLC